MNDELPVPPNGTDVNEGGQVNITIIAEAGNVKINFGKTVAWIGMTPKQAIGLASLIIKHAIDAAKASGEVLPLEIIEAPIKAVNET